MRFTVALRRRAISPFGMVASAQETAPLPAQSLDEPRSRLRVGDELYPGRGRTNNPRRLFGATNSAIEVEWHRWFRFRVARSQLAVRQIRSGTRPGTHS